MKMKSLAMLAMSGLVAASFAYVAPAMADDTSNIGQAAPSDNSMQNSNSQNSTGSTPSDNSMNNNSNSTGNTGNSGSTDEGSPDTATGDDDY